MNNLIIKDFTEVVQRKQFNLNQHVTLENFNSLISLIRLPKNQENLTKCQIHKKQNTCNHHFMYGYLVSTKEDTEAIIGGTCGNQYFHLDETFSIQRNRLEKEVALEDTLQTILNQLAALKEPRINEVENQLKNIGEKVRSLISSYPDSAKKMLEQMAKSKNSTVFISVDYIETEEKNNTEHNWTKLSVGNIKGIYIWSYQDNLGQAFTLMNKLKHTLPKVKIDKMQGLRQLKKWASILSSISEITDYIDRANSEYIHFMSIENILMTTQILTNREERLKIVAQVLTNGNTRDAQKILSEFDKATRYKFKNRNIKLAA